MKNNKGFPHSFQNTAPLICSQIAISHIKSGADTMLEQGRRTKVLGRQDFLNYAPLKEYTPINVYPPVASQPEVHSYCSNLALVGGAA